MAATLLCCIRQKIFALLIGRNPMIKKEYLNYIQHRESQRTLDTLKKALGWRIKYGIFRSTPQKRISKLYYPETEGNKRWNSEFLHMYKRALEADIVSLDLFDTMILSPFTDTGGLFLLLEKKWGAANFKVLRVRAEYQALADKKERQEQVTLLDIYSVLETWSVVSAEEGARTEAGLAKELYFVNPEIKKMYDSLRAAGKAIIFLADTYLSSDDLEEILHKNGIDGYEKVFVSCDYSIKLQHQAENYFGRKNKFYHITCHRDSDFASRKAVGWDIGYYSPLNKRGEKYRPYDMSADVKSIYDSICNSWLYSRQEVQSIFYEFGFTCGGILAIGLCQWLNRMAKQFDFEQILFVARDGDIISQIYQKYFNQVENDYLLFSRMASEQLVFEDFTEEYINHVILPELQDAGDSYTIGSLFWHIGIEEIRKDWEREGFSWDALVKTLDYEQIRMFIYKYKHEIKNIFHDADCGAEKYFHSVIGSNRQICVFDIGWRGTSAVYLKHLLERKYQFPVHVTGALLGGGDENYANSFFMDDTILTFAFSHYKNFKIMEEICQSQECILAMELLFSSDSPSLLTYGLDLDGRPAFHFEKENPQAAMIQEIQRGIMDYADWYYKVLGGYADRIRIHSQDALAPVMTVLRNKKYVKKLTENSTKRANARHGF